MLLLFRNTRWFGIKLKGPTSQRRMEEKLDEEEKR